MSFSVYSSNMGKISIVPFCPTGKLSLGQEQIPKSENAGSCGGQGCCLLFVLFSSQKFLLTLRIL